MPTSRIQVGFQDSGLRIPNFRFRAQGRSLRPTTHFRASTPASWLAGLGQWPKRYENICPVASKIRTFRCNLDCAASCCRDPTKKMDSGQVEIVFMNPRILRLEIGNACCRLRGSGRRADLKRIGNVQTQAATWLTEKGTTEPSFQDKVFAVIVPRVLSDMRHVGVLSGSSKLHAWLQPWFSTSFQMDIAAR